MGWTIKTTTDPEFRIGEYIKVNGIIGVWGKWEQSLPGRVVGLALETNFNPDDTPQDAGSPPWLYHVLLDDGTHVYSMAYQLERTSVQHTT